MALGPVPPFTQEHASLCRQGLRSLAKAREMMDRAEACGVDCTQDRSIAEALKQSLEAFQVQFCEPPVGQRKESIDGQERSS